MKAGSLVAIIVLAAYLGFEAYAFSKARHRMEPAYIHDLLVKANTAIQACNAPEVNLQSRFDQTLKRLIDRYSAELFEQHPQKDSSAINKMIAQNAAAAQQDIETQLASTGCGTIEMKKHFRLFEIYAKKTR